MAKVNVSPPTSPSSARAVFGGNATISGSTLTVKMASVAAQDNAATVTIGFTSGNYDISDADIVINVSDKYPVTVSGVTVNSRAYNGSAVAPGGTPVFTNTILGTAVTLTPVYTWSSGAAPTGAGSYTLTVSADGGAEYEVAPLVIPFKITKADQTITFPQPGVNRVGRSETLSASGGGSTTTTTTTTTTTWLEQNPAGTLAGTANGSNQDYARTKSTGAYGVRKAAFAALAGLRFEHDTVADGAVQIRLSIDDPEKITQDVMVSGYVKGGEVDRIRSHFEKWFKSKVQAIHMDQADPWGQPVKIAARLDLTGMDTKNLCFYSYDKKTNTYKRIKKPAYWIDKNGYLHFTTEYPGDIIISEGSLERK